MQTQPEPVAPAYAQQGAMGENKVDEETSSPGKKSMLKKVKDKAKKLKSKVKKPKSPGSANSGTVQSSSSSSAEEESGSEPQQQAGHDGKHERDMVINPGLQGNAYEAVPDPHATDATAGIGGVEKQFGQMGMDDKPDASKLQDQVPSAAGGASAGLTSYLASRDLAQSPHATGSTPVDEGIDAEGRDLLVAPTTNDPKEPAAKDEEKSPAAWYTPTSDEKTSEKNQEQKPLTDRVTEGVAATVAAGAGAVGLKALSDDSEKIGSKDTDGCENTDSKDTDISPPTFTERAVGLKDTMAGKLGYGSNQDLPAEEDSDMAPMQADPQDSENKTILDKVKGNAAGASEAVTTKLGYGEGDATKTGDGKTYTQKAYDAAYGAKDAVAAKLGYGSTDPSADKTAEGEQKSYIQSAKEAVASKLGYENKELPLSSTEGAYGDEQNTPASTAARFHPGDEDTALSQLITEKLSTGVATVKDTLMRPFGSPKSGSPTPPPSSAIEDPAHKTVSEEREGLTPEEKPADMVGKVTGAVTSLMGTTPGSEKKEREEERLGKANEDTQAVETH